MRENIRTHRDLDVYQRAFTVAMESFEISKEFPADERYAMSSQIRRSLRSVRSNIADAWRKRRCQPAWIAKLSDAETEAGETQSHLEFCVACGYTDAPPARGLCSAYNSILRTLVGVITHADNRLIRSKGKP